MASKDPVRQPVAGDRRAGRHDLRRGRQDRRAKTAATGGDSGGDGKPRSVTEIREELHDRRGVTIAARTAAAAARNPPPPRRR